MAIQNNPQAEGRAETEGKKWAAIDEIPLRSPLKPLSTNRKKQDDGKEVAIVEEEEEECSTTPISEESRIPTMLTCPPAPRRPRPAKPDVIKSQPGVVKQQYVYISPQELLALFQRPSDS